MFLTIFIFIVGVMNIFLVYTLFQKKYTFEKKLIPRDISEHTETYPTFFEIHSAIKGEQSPWTFSLEKERIVNNNWLGHIL